MDRLFGRLEESETSIDRYSSKLSERLSLDSVTFTGGTFHLCATRETESIFLLREEKCHQKKSHSLKAVCHLFDNLTNISARY